MLLYKKSEKKKMHKQSLDQSFNDMCFCIEYQKKKKKIASAIIR